MVADRKALGESAWPADGLEWVAACPVCGSDKRRVLYEGLRDRLYGAPGLWTLQRCGGCGAAYLDPRPTKETIGLAYRSYFTHQAPDFDRSANGVSVLRRARRAVANGYLNRRFGTDFRPASRVGGLLATFLPLKRHQLDSYGRHLPRPWPGARLLDIGCGNGEFLAFAQRAGWSVVGVQPDESAAQIARERGLEVLGDIAALGEAREIADVITLSHVIEHVHDPLGLLRRCRELLRPGGWLWIDTPNLESIGHRRYRHHWRGLEPPRHLVLFDWTSLASALSEAGFTALRSAPWRPVAIRTLPVSSVMASDGAYEDGQALPLVPRMLGLVADLSSWANVRRREFVTVLASKWGSSMNG